MAELNRAQRRAAKNGRPVRPMMVEVYKVFAPIEAIFADLRRGEISAIDGKPVFNDGEALAEIAPSIAGWCDLWAKLCEHYRQSIDLSPLEALGVKLAQGEMLTHAEIERAYAVIDRCRQLYRNMDVYVVRSMVNTQCLKFMFEDIQAAQAA